MIERGVRCSCAATRGTERGGASLGPKEVGGLKKYVIREIDQLSIFLCGRSQCHLVTVAAKGRLLPVHV